MAIIKKTELFYELMIRGNWDPQKGELGAITTYQLQTGTALVETDTNALAAPYAPDPAVDLTKDQAIAFLGKKFAGFLDQLAAERSQAEAAASEAKRVADAALAALQASTETALTEMQAQRNATLAENLELQTKLANFAGRVVEAHNEAAGKIMAAHAEATVVTPSAGGAPPAG